MGDVSATTLLFDRQRKPFSVPALNQRSQVDLRSALARSILWHRPIRFCFLSLRLLFPARTAFVGLLLAAFLPMQLYLAHYVTNEILAATLATAALYLCLRLLRSEKPRASQFAWLGLAMGAAMLAKATGILLLPILIAATAAKLAVTRASVAISLRN